MRTVKRQSSSSLMKNSSPKFQYYSGKKAIIANWIIYYDCKVKFDQILKLEKNIEIIMNQDNEVVAKRYDSPDNIKSLKENDGEWKLTEVAKSYNSQEKENYTPLLLILLR